MAERKRSEPTEEHIEEAGKPPLDDEVLPEKGEPVAQEDTGGDTPDPLAGEKDDVNPRGASTLERTVEEEREGGQ